MDPAAARGDYKTDSKGPSYRAMLANCDSGQETGLQVVIDVTDSKLLKIWYLKLTSCAQARLPSQTPYSKNNGKRSLKVSCCDVFQQFNEELAWRC